jgi:hypothetical protein
MCLLVRHVARMVVCKTPYATKVEMLQEVEAERRFVCNEELFASTLEEESAKYAEILGNAYNCYTVLHHAQYLPSVLIKPHLPFCFVEFRSSRPRMRLLTSALSALIKYQCVFVDAHLAC